MSLSTKRIVIVDDHLSARDGSVTRVELEGGLEFVGEASDVDEAITVSGELLRDGARIKEKLEIDDMASLTREATQWVLENG